MQKRKVIDFVAVLVVMEHMQTLVAVEARVFWVFFASGRHPGGGEGVARATTQAVRAQDVVHDGVTRAVETVVGRKQSHVGEDEEVLAVALVQIDVGLAEPNVEVDESSFGHVGLFEVAQFLLFGPVNDGFAVIHSVGGSEWSS